MLERHSASYGWSASTEGRTVSIVCRIALPDGWTQLHVGPAQGTRRWASDRYVNLNPEEARALIEEIAEDCHQRSSTSSASLTHRRRAQALLQAPKVVRCPSS